jgi:hypothetical protein
MERAIVMHPKSRSFHIDHLESSKFPSPASFFPSPDSPPEIPFSISAPNSLTDPPPIFGLLPCLIHRGQFVLLRPRDSSVGKIYSDLIFFKQIDLVHHYAAILTQRKCLACRNDD